MISYGKVQAKSKFDENLPIWWSQERVRFTHPLEEIAKRPRWCTEKPQMIPNHFKGA